MVNTDKIRNNLGTRKSIGLLREDVIALLECYEKHNNPSKGEMNFPSDFDAKH